MNEVKVTWKSVRDLPSAWAHIRSSIAGKRDTCQCLICEEIFDLEQKGRERSSVLLEVARKHFYKHKLQDNFSPRPEPIEQRYEIFDAIERAAQV